MISVEVLRTIDQDLRPLLLEVDSDAIGRAVAEWSKAGFAVRVLRGTRMTTVQGVFTEFAAALKFPHYFGHNKDAFDECIADLSWLPPGLGYVLLITEPDQVLANEPRTSLHWLVASLKSAAVELAQPLSAGEWWDRPAVPFHVVLAGDGRALQRSIARWTAAGAKLMDTVSAADMSDSTLDEFMAGELNEFIRNQLLAAIAQLEAGRRYFTYNSFNVLLDADTGLATVEDELDPHRQRTIPLRKFETLIRSTIF